MNIAIVLYDRFTALDAIGPYEVLSRLPGASVTFAAAEAGPVQTDNGMLTLLAERPLSEVERPDIVLVPGGPGEVAARAGGAVLDWLRAADAHQHVDDIGVHRLADPRRCRAARRTSARPRTGWRSSSCARSAPSRCPSASSSTASIVTAAGVSAGIDMALTLAAEIAGEDVAQAIQLGIEYDPQPPFDAGSPAKAPQAIVELARAATAAFVLEGEDALTASG